MSTSVAPPPIPAGEEDPSAGEPLAQELDADVVPDVGEVPKLPHNWPHACEVHERLPAIAGCKRCGRMLCISCRTVSPLDRFSYCPMCLAQNLIDNAPPPSPVEQRVEELASMHEPGSLEAHSARDVPSAMRAAMTKPSAFFASLAKDGGVAAALLVGVISNILGTFFLLLWLPTMPDGPQLFLAQLQVQAGVSQDVFMLGLLLAMPFITIFEVLLYAAALHSTLGFFGHRVGPFKLSFKVVAYSLVARLLLVFPYGIGRFAASIYGVALLIMGVRYAHRAPLLKTALAVLVPVLLFGGLSIMAVAETP